MPNCAVKSCKNNTSRNKKDTGITYHQFPTDPVISDRWTAVIQRSREESRWKPRKRSVICSTHFNNSDLYITRGGRKRVYQRAIPKNALFISPTQSDNASNKIITEEPYTSVSNVDETILSTGFGTPPLDIKDTDFDEEVLDEEKECYKAKFPDLNEIVSVRLHCTACDRHLGCSARSESRMRAHPMLKTLICVTCHSFYNSGEFDRGEDGSELYCRWCGQGGQVYCCSNCIHVFCAKCIKRNFGLAKIKEIENTDDWKCFKCNPRCLWDLRATCWALLLYVEFRNRLVQQTEDPELKENYEKAVSIDMSECCKHKVRRRETAKKKEKEDNTVAKKKEKEENTIAKKKEKEDTTLAKKKDKVLDIFPKKIITKVPPSIQVKKFASLNLEHSKMEKKAQKRSASPQQKFHNIAYIQKPVSIPSPHIIKKIRVPNNVPMINPIRFTNDKKVANTYNRMPNRSQFPIPIANASFNGFNNTHIFNTSGNNISNITGDNINLSLETLTQGLDMASMASFGNNTPSEDNVVCTPDFPMEPLCEVTEDLDDDVECITPGPVAAPMAVASLPPPLAPRSYGAVVADNVVQMTENDVTVNALTGGLKFRVDPQTLSSKKMYRLPDGRIFAINPNPNMPGGYSATIVSVSDCTGKYAKGGETFAAKLSTVTPPSGSKTKTPRLSNVRKSKPKPPSPPKQQNKDETRECDMKVPVEWFRYNLIEATDALEYSLERLNKLKNEATTKYLRTRTASEIKYLHGTLDRALSTSSKRFLEVRENLNVALKNYIMMKINNNKEDCSEDDDVEILPNTEDDPIFIDENSLESVNCNESQEVDLTGAGSSEHNDSGDKRNELDPLLCTEQLVYKKLSSDYITDCNDSDLETDGQTNTKQDSYTGKSNESENALTENTNKHRDDLVSEQDDAVTDLENANGDKDAKNGEASDEKDTKEVTKESNLLNSIKENAINKENESSSTNEEKMDVDTEQDVLEDKADLNTDQTPDPEMTEELIENLLKDDVPEIVNSLLDTSKLDSPDILQNKE